MEGKTSYTDLVIIGAGPAGLMAAAWEGRLTGQNTGDLTKDGHHWKKSCFIEAQALANRTDEIVFTRFEDPNILPYVHVRLAFMVSMVHIPAAKALCDGFNWHLLACVLNATLSSVRRDDASKHNRLRRDKASKRKAGGRLYREQPLPEDWTLRGLLWTRELFRQDHFHEADQDERKLEMERPSRTNDRKRRVVNLGNRLAAQGHWLTYDHLIDQFIVSAAYEKAFCIKLLIADKDQRPPYASE